MNVRPGVVARLAWRDLRGGLHGFWIFLACIALGVTAITGVGAVADGLARGLSAQGRTILGGDLAVARVGAPPDPAETAILDKAGRTSLTATIRAMARRPDNTTTLVDVKAVDGRYPLVGAVTLEPPGPLSAALAPDAQGRFGLVADPTLAARLAVRPGDELKIGNATFVLRATLEAEPDKLASGIAFGPRVMMSREALAASGLAGPLSVVRWSTRLDLGGTGAVASEADLARASKSLQAALAGKGWEFRERGNVSPEFDRNLARFRQFLTLVGLTALVVGGVGVANAVRATVERKRASLAILKSLGATGGAVVLITLAQVLAVACLGIAAGLALGAALPFALQATFGALIPFPLAPAITPQPLLTGAVYGLLTTLAFSLGALGRAHDIPVSALFRDAVEPDPGALRWRYRWAVIGAVLLLTTSVFLLSADWRLSAFFVAGTAVSMAALRAVAFGIERLARTLPRAKNTVLRLAVANIHRPGALTASVVLSLGLGLTLLVTLTLIDANVRRQISDAASGTVPSFFFIDIPSAQSADFTRFVEKEAPGVTVATVPMMRGRIVALNGTPAEKWKPKASAAFALEGDRGITTAESLPDGSTLAAGQWWPKDYAGKPLVSFDVELAEGLGLKLGDSVTVNVLGRDITATIASLRRIEWQKLGINFFMVFSPNTFAGAPFSTLATATFPGGASEGREVALLKAVAGQYPTVTAVRVSDVLNTLNHLVGQLAVAIRGASGVAVATAVLVLAGAVAAGRRARVYDAVVLKVLGATRGRLLLAMVIEYGLLGVVTAVFGVAAGTLAARLVVVRVMDFTFSFAWGEATAAALGALALTVALGLLGTWRILGEKPAAHLRAR